jgi:hypothetical protein
MWLKIACETALHSPAMTDLFAYLASARRIGYANIST